MAKDFKAGQIKTSKIIGKTGEKTVFYTDAESSDDSGGHAVPVGGNDVSFVFSGDDGDKGGATGGVTLFNGDIVVSGTLYAEKQVIDVHTGAGGLTIDGATPITTDSGNVYNCAIHISGVDAGAIIWDAGDAAIFENGGALVLSSSNGMALTPGSGEVVINPGQNDVNFRIEGDNTDYLFFTDAGNDIVSIQGAIGDNSNLFQILGNDDAGTGNGAGLLIVSPDETVVNPSGGDVDFRVESNTLQGAILVDSADDQVLLASNNTTAAGASLGTDVNVFVDGIAGSKDSVNKGTTVFVGDVVISGSLHGGSPLKIGTDTRLDAVAGSTQYFNFGATDGSAGYGLRSNAGAIEFKNNAGAWAGIGSGGGGSSAGNDLYQVSDGAGGFYSAPTVIMGYNTVNKKTTLGIDHLTGGGTARFTVATESTDNASAVDIVHVATGGYQSNPALNIIANTDPTVYSPLVTINSRNDKNIIELTNGFHSSIKSSSIKYEYSDLSIKNNQIDGYVALEATRSVDPYYTSGDVDVIKCIKGSTANDPTVTILTNPSAPPAAILNSNDINFYVEGTPGSLGPGGPKGTSNFGGDVKVEGCVVRGGILHLSRNTAQNYNLATSGVYSAVPISGFVDHLVWNNSIITDTTFYSFSGKDITINKSGVYKISYTVNFSQITPASNRINMRTFLNLTTTAVDVPIDCSEAFSYGRGDGSGDTVSKISNSCTTTKLLSAGNIINLNMMFIHGTTNAAISVNVRSNQAWILIEKIG